MGKPKEEVDKAKTENGQFNGQSGVNGGEINQNGISGSDSEDGSTQVQGHCSRSRPRRGEREEINVTFIDPVYYGLLSCPRSPTNFYTKIAISMCALLKSAEINAIKKHRRNLRRTRSANL